MNSPLQPYDFLMLAVLLLSTLFGAWKGMAWQIASLASLILSTAVAVHFSGPLAPYFSAQAPWNRFVTMFVLYLLTSLVIWLAFRVVAKAISRVKLKDFDRQAGALFGAAKGVLWCLVITFFAVTLSESARQAILHTRSGYYTTLLIHNAAPVLPQEVRNVVGGYLDELDRKLDTNGQSQPPGPQPATKQNEPARVANWLGGASAPRLGQGRGPCCRDAVFRCARRPVANGCQPLGRRSALVAALECGDLSPLWPWQRVSPRA